MLELLLDSAFTYGIFAGLFVWLLYTTNKRNEAREQMYQEVIKENQRVIAEQAGTLSAMSGDIREIKCTLIGGNQ